MSGVFLGHTVDTCSLFFISPGGIPSHFKCNLPLAYTSSTDLADLSTIKFSDCKANMKLNRFLPNVITMFDSHVGLCPTSVELVDFHLVRHGNGTTYRLRLGLHEISSVRFGSLWIGFTLARIHLNCVRFRLHLHGIGYVQIRLGSGPLWYGSTLFIRDWFETGMVRLHIGSFSKVGPFGAS